MAYRRRSEAEPSTTLDFSLYGSEPIAGDSQTRAPPASQGAWTEQSDYSDFGDPYRPSKRSPTYPFVPCGSSDAHTHRTSGRVSNVFSKILKREVDDGHSFTGPNNIRHASTFDTYKSASFEDTAVWDEKAILSLGMYPFPAPSVMRNTLILALKLYETSLPSSPEVVFLEYSASSTVTTRYFRMFAERMPEMSWCLTLAIYDLSRLPLPCPLLHCRSRNLIMKGANWFVDGGGIRGYSALLILQELMRAIGKIESAYACGPHKADGPAKSSYHPLTPLPSAPGMATNIKPKAKNGHEPAETDSSPWLPCHYFDYVAGTSTGGYDPNAFYLREPS